MNEKPQEYNMTNIKNTIDIWLPLEMVVEIKAADLQVSPVHTCGQGDLGELSKSIKHC